MLFQRDKEKNVLVPFWAHGRIPERKVREEQVVRERMEKVLGRVMRPLWELEIHKYDVLLNVYHCIYLTIVG